MSKRWELTFDDPVKTAAKGHKAARIALWSMKRSGDEVATMAAVVLKALCMSGPNDADLMEIASRIRDGLICWQRDPMPLRDALADAIPAFARVIARAHSRGA